MRLAFLVPEIGASDTGNRACFGTRKFKNQGPTPLRTGYGLGPRGSMNCTEWSDAMLGAGGFEGWVSGS